MLARTLSCLQDGYTIDSRKFIHIKMEMAVWREL